MDSSKALVIIVFMVSSLLQHLNVSSFQYEVGGTNGWAVPPSNHKHFYNEWASKNRFQIGDAIHFKYGKDSVMLVTEPEYNQCNCTHPFFYANNGNTEFRLDRSGCFYFISGMAGHCERREKMVIKVMEEADDSDSNHPEESSSSAVKYSSVGAQIVLSFVGSSVLFF